MITLQEFIDKLKLAHDVPNYYNNHFPKNCGYYDAKLGKFSFDCWNLVKVILSGWTNTMVDGYYISPKQFVTGDCDGYTLLKKCSGQSKDFSKLKQPGTYLYLSTSPHAGVYVGDFIYQGHVFNVVECTGAWESKVQYTYVDEKGGRFLYKGGSKSKYSWTDYGLLTPYVDYGVITPTPKPEPKPEPQPSLSAPEYNYLDVDFSPVFDPIYYADKYPDLKAAFGYDQFALWNHFIVFGMNEFRQASKKFNPQVYYDRYEDLRNAFGDFKPLYYWHYCYFGIKEGRSAV